MIEKVKIIYTNNRGKKSIYNHSFYAIKGGFAPSGNYIWFDPLEGLMRITKMIAGNYMYENSSSKIKDRIKRVLDNINN